MDYGSKIDPWAVAAITVVAANTITVVAAITAVEAVVTAMAVMPLNIVRMAAARNVLRLPTPPLTP